MVGISEIMVLVFSSFLSGAIVSGWFHKKYGLKLSAKETVRELARVRDDGGMDAEKANRLILSIREERDRIRAHERKMAVREIENRGRK